MKKLKIFLSVCFFLLLLAPMAAFNWKDSVASKIDNRKLADNPFGRDFEKDGGLANLSDNIESYLEDRIGFRDDMIYDYMMLHDKLFHEMVHPSYMYGKDDYVFKKAVPNTYFDEYHRAFVNMVKEIHDYCAARNVPFLFVFDPEKEAVLTDKLAPGIHYNDDWVGQLENELRKQGVNYVDNTKLLKEKTKQGETVFNKQYNAGHWNDLGAFYGVNNMLKTMKKDCPGIHINKKDEFDIQQVLRTTLPVSEYPIHEYEPIFQNRCELTDETPKYDKEVKRDKEYGYFEYVINEQRKREGSPKVLVFQGSYMNEMGYKFMENSFGEYIAVHNYQNVIDFPYYFNIFKPQYVVFDAAQYVFMNEYFNYANMRQIKFNPVLHSYNGLPVKSENISGLSLETSQGDALVTLKTAHLPEDTLYAYLISNGEVFDFQKKTEEGKTWYEATIDKAKYNPRELSVEAVDNSERELTKYR